MDTLFSKNSNTGVIALDSGNFGTPVTCNLVITFKSDVTLLCM